MFVRRLMSSIPPVSPKYWILFYNYVPNAVERRAPFRPAHFELANQYKKEGTLVLGGAFAEPVDGAALIFRCEDKKTVEDFAQKDPYVQNKIVRRYTVREWTVVIS